jgi:hypothetical protein
MNEDRGILRYETGVTPYGITTDEVTQLLQSLCLEESVDSRGDDHQCTYPKHHWGYHSAGAHFWRHGLRSYFRPTIIFKFRVRILSRNPYEEIMGSAELQDLLRG